MSGLENGDGWISPADALNALKDVTNIRISPAEEGGWSKASAYGDRGRLSRDYGGHNDYDGDAHGKSTGSCFKYGFEGEMKSECPEPIRPIEECYKSGEVDRNEADRADERRASPFAGICNICQEGEHRANEYPAGPAKLCMNCEDPDVDDHTADMCRNRCKIQPPPVIEGQAEEAWHLLEAAAREGDMEDVKEAMKMYTDALPDVTYPDLEEAFRNMNIPVYLVAIEKSVINSFTIIDLQGNIDKQYAVWIRKSPKPSRPYEAEMWPATPEENFERLKDAGVVESRRAVRCSGCGELGHTYKYCQGAVPVVTQGRIIHRYYCSEDGQRYRDCRKLRKDKNTCRSFKQSAHEPRECPELRKVNIICKICDQMGHSCHDCSVTDEKEYCDRGLNRCLNCASEDHMFTECPLPRRYSHVKCKICGEMGHTAVRCKSDNDRAYGGHIADALIEPDDGGWAATSAYVDDDVLAKASGCTKLSMGNEKAGEEPSVSDANGYDPSGSVRETTPAKRIMALYSSSGKGLSQIATPSSVGQASTAPPSGSFSRSGSNNKMSPHSSFDSPWDGLKLPASINSIAFRPCERSEKSWDSWGICARDEDVDQCSGNRQYQRSTGSGRIFSDTKITPGEKLRPLFYNDGKNRHVKLASTLPIIPSPLGDVPVTADNRFSQFTYNYEDGDGRRVSQLSLNSDENDEDIPRPCGFVEISSSPVTTESGHNTNMDQAGTRSSVPAYAYQPARNPVGGGVRPFSIKPTAPASTSKTNLASSAEEDPVVAVATTLPLTPQETAKFMQPRLIAVNAKSPAIKSTSLGSVPRARASTVGKPFLPAHMATPPRPVERATDLPYRDMEHLERTPPPKGAEVFFDHNVAEYAVVDESAPASPTTTPDGSILPTPGPSMGNGW